jgi:predicted transcriptional regulator
MSYLDSQSIAVTQLPGLIRSVYEGFREASSEPTRLRPAVSIAKSVHPDFLICLEDGKKLTMLKRYLRTQYDLTPEAYRKRWALPADYPMVAPAYAAKRSAFAKSSGLGRSVRRNGVG